MAVHRMKLINLIIRQSQEKFRTNILGMFLYMKISQYIHISLLT